MATSWTMIDVAIGVQYRFDLDRCHRRCDACPVSLAQIRYFVAVAEEGHVGRAAARLRVAQPPISRQIRALEDEIGTPLFARTSRGMALLPSGEAFLHHARAILSEVHRASDAARRAADGVSRFPVPRPAED